MPIRLHIFGASGSGVSTLGSVLADELEVAWIESDDSYWLPTDPPFQRDRPIPERLAHLNARLNTADDWVLSGTLVSWGQSFVPHFEGAVYLHLDTDIRVQRLKERQAQMFGRRVVPGGDMHGTSLAFYEWASQYESGLRNGRSRQRHEQFMTQLSCPLLRLEGDLSVNERLARVLEWRGVQRK